MVEELNILLDAAVELGKPETLCAGGGSIRITGVSKAGEAFTLALEVTEADHGRDQCGL